MDEVLKNTPPKPGETNSEYGTRIHKELELAIRNRKEFRGMRAEVSFAVDKPDAKYGTAGSIRVDVIEDFGNGTACIYDYKLGKAILRSVGCSRRHREEDVESQRAISKDDPREIRRIVIDGGRREEQQQRTPRPVARRPASIGDTATRVLSRPRHSLRYAATSATAPRASRVRLIPDFGRSADRVLPRSWPSWIRQSHHFAGHAHTLRRLPGCRTTISNTVNHASLH